MRTLIAVSLLSLLAIGCRTQKPPRQTAVPSKPLPEGSELYRKFHIHVTCEPAYYRRYSDGHLVSAEDARYGEDFSASGIVLRIVKPESFAGKIIAFHFDFPEKWNAWYKADVIYEGTIDERYVGMMAFMCDPGWKPPATGKGAT